MLAIETKNLIKNFNGKIAVNGIDLKIKEGILFSLLGVNGAGKTTTIKMLTGLTIPSGGEILINGKHLSNEIKNIMNVSPQETAIAPNLTVKENLEFIEGVYKVSNKTEKLLKEFKLESVKNQKAKTLSGGYQRRLSIAMALINDPKILFLDEPTLGLDVIARRELWNIIKSLKEKMTIILTTHYMEEAERLSDEVGIMAQGNLICTGTPKELINKAKVNSFEDAFVTLATGGDL